VPLHRTLYSLDLRAGITAGMLCRPTIVLAGFQRPTLDELPTGTARMTAELNAGKLTALHDALIELRHHAKPPFTERKVLALCAVLKSADDLATGLEKSAEKCGDHLTASFISGEMSIKERNEKLQRLCDEPCDHVVTSAQALQEGVDVPWCDAAAFMSPCGSAYTAAQKMGRALRLYEKKDDIGQVVGTKSAAYIIVPVLNDSNFEEAIGFLTVLASVDTDVAHLIRMRGAALYSPSAAAALKGKIHDAQKKLFMCTGIDLLDKVMEQLQMRLAEKFDREVYGAMVAHLHDDPDDTPFAKLSLGPAAREQLDDVRTAAACGTGVVLPYQADRIALLRKNKA
jgi:hypothetical protein